VRFQLPVNSYERASPIVGGTRLLNCYAESKPNNGPVVLIRAPGLVEKTSIPEGAGRGIYNWNGQLYAVVGSKLYLVNPLFGHTEIGTILGSKRVSWGVNASQLVICSQPYAYVLEGTTLTRITDGDFLIPAQVCSVDGYAIFREQDTGRFFGSDLNDALSYDALYYATAEGAPGDLVGILTDHRQVLLVKADSTELWEDVGGSGFPFARSVNGFTPMGCAAGDTLVAADNSVYMLASDRTIRRLMGITWTNVSQPGVDEAIRSYDVTGAYGLSYTQDGHVFVAFTFPVPEKTWVLDVSSGEWHERSSVGNRWRPSAIVMCYGKSYAQRYDTGAVCLVEPNAYDDCGDSMRVEWTYQPAYRNNDRLFHSALECVMETGVGGTGGDGGGYIEGYFEGGLGSTSNEDPQILLSMSNDGGRTWVEFPHKSLGKKGERLAVVRWSALGSSKERVYKMAVTDPVKVVVTDTQLEVA